MRFEEFVDPEKIIFWADMSPILTQQLHVHVFVLPPALEL